MTAAGGEPRITLLTDFGTRDGYVAAMRGVIAAIAPEVIVDDATHDIPPGDILAGALALERYWRLYPPGTVHVAVVDPGVGTERRALAVSADGRTLVAPDNGILTLALDVAAKFSAFDIREPAFLHGPVSATFHGRDVFASVAAHIAARISPAAVGPAIDDPVRLEIPAARVRDSAVIGIVLGADRFGNLITNIGSSHVRPGACVVVAGLAPIDVRATYGAVAAGELVALIGSGGRLEISVRNGSAAARLEARRGTPVRLEVRRQM